MARLTTRPDYDGAADGWASGAALVYGPLADELLALVPPADWAGRRVLDLGAGTGVVSERLVRCGARPVGLDLSASMLAHRRRHRPPGVVADVLALPVRDAGCDAVAASFVLNHVDDPGSAFRELARAVHPGDPNVASVFSDASSHAGRDRVDDVVTGAGWTAPTWYAELKAHAVPLLATADAMAAVATAAGLDAVVVDERPVDVGVTTPADLVDYRLGQAHVADFLRGLDDEQRGALRRRAIEAVGEPMAPYRPTVVFLSARRPRR